MIHNIKKFRLLSSLIFISGCIILLLLILSINTTALNKMDIAIYNSISKLQSSFATVFFILISELGTWGTIFIAVSWSLLAKKRHLTFLFSLIISLLGTQFLYFALKDLFNRPRPQYPHLIHYSGDSFPSGHSTTAIVFYCVVIYFLYKNNPFSKHVSSVICVLFTIIVFLIGISRIYLGVHYFSDVAGGFLTGFIWVMALYLLTTQRR